MAPPSKPPAQAGRFKPRKRLTKTTIPKSASTSTSIYNPNQTPNDSRIGTPSTTIFAKEERGSIFRGGANGAGGRMGRGGRSRMGQGRSGRGPGRGPGRGRGRGRGGRIPLPKGQVFFTGNATRQGISAVTDTSAIAGTTAIIPPGLDGSVIMPGMSKLRVGMRGSERDSRSRYVDGEEVIVGEIEGGGVGLKGSKDSGPETILSRTKLGESMFEDEEDDGPVGTYNQGAYTFDSDSSTDNDDYFVLDKDDETNQISKMKKKKQQQQLRRKMNQSNALQPHQLPFQIPKPISDAIPRQVMYECQEAILKKDFIIQRQKRQQKHEESKRRSRILESDSDDDESHHEPYLIRHQEGKDPPLYNPFLPTNNTHRPQSVPIQTKRKPALSTLLAEHRKERDSWMLFQFPTRLPRIKPQSTLSGMAMTSEKLAEQAVLNSILQQQNGNVEANLKGTINKISDEELARVVAAQTAAETAAANFEKLAASTNVGATSNSRGGGGGMGGTVEGYDDTLKDVAAGKYGTIHCYKSGKLEFIIGEKNPKKHNTNLDSSSIAEDHQNKTDKMNESDEIRMLIYEGLQTSFVQEAVVIDPDEGSYIPIGKVKKSMVVVPDMDSAFS